MSVNVTNDDVIYKMYQLEYVDHLKEYIALLKSELSHKNAVINELLCSNRNNVDPHCNYNSNRDVNYRYNINDQTEFPPLNKGIVNENIPNVDNIQYDDQHRDENVAEK